MGNVLNTYLLIFLITNLVVGIIQCRGSTNILNKELGLVFKVMELQGLKATASVRGQWPLLSYLPLFPVPTHLASPSSLTLTVVKGTLQWLWIEFISHFLLYFIPYGI